MAQDTQSRPGATSRTQSHTPVRNIATYQRPMLAVVSGMPVRIIATGDREGSSPVCQFVDPDGAVDWVPINEVKILDHEFLPPSLETLQQIFSTLRK